MQPQRSLHPFFPWVAALGVALTCGACGRLPGAPQPVPAEVTIVSPTNGAVVDGPFAVVARERDPDRTAGHLHVIVDDGCVDPGTLIPITDRHLHLAAGASSMILDLPVGVHEICVQLSDEVERAHGAGRSVTVEVRS